MLVTRLSPVTGKLNTREIAVSEEDYRKYLSGEGGLIQEMFPDLSPDDREFLISGCTREDWDELFPEEEGS